MPADYVNKLARMFQDIKVSEDLNQSFKEMHKHNKLALPGKRTAIFCKFSYSVFQKSLENVVFLHMSAVQCSLIKALCL